MELVCILFVVFESGVGNFIILLFDELINYFDVDLLGWLWDFLCLYMGGLVVISYNVDLVVDVVNKVWFLDVVCG